MDSNVLFAPFLFVSMYLILEACDWGLSLAAPLVTKNQEERQAILGVMKPGLDGNEGWFFLGMILLGSLAMPAMGGAALPAELLMGLVVIGALLRIAGCYGKKALGNGAFLLGLCGFSVIALAVLGLFSASLLSETKSLFSGLGICTALWFILSAFQTGAIFGAAKVMNPLGERLRAAFLVSCPLTLVLFLVTAFVLKGEAGDVSFFWAGLGASVILQIAAFLLTRMRQVAVGLAAAYISLAASVILYFTAVSERMASLYASALASTGSAPDTMVMAGVAGWTVAAFLWRLSRKKETYDWKDHI